MVEMIPGIIKIQLFISCRQLKDIDKMSKSDPFVEIFKKTHQTEWEKIGQTEVIWDCLNPDFIKNFIIEYCFEIQTFLLFKVFDANIEDNIEVKGEAIGEAECMLGEILGTKGQQIIKPLCLPNKNPNKSTGNIILRAEQLQMIDNNVINLIFCAKDLEDYSNACMCHTFSPMFYLSRLMENGPNQRVYSSEFGVGQNINWKKITISTQDLCNYDLSRSICFELYDYYRNGQHKYIGGFEFTMNKITEEGQRKFEIVNPNKKRGGSYINSGIVIISSVDISTNYSFLDYIAGGCEISLLIAIDFTASNGDVTKPDSLHYISPDGYNHYQSALRAVAEILLNYDSDKLVPVHGFGGDINNAVQHCFPLNFNTANPEVKGLEGIMEIYSQSIKKIGLNGPTLFGPVIENAVNIAEAAQVNQSNQHYYILLILTDGEIHDMHNTKNLVVKGSNFPLSIIIVGVGDADFTYMKILDADNEPLVDSKGTKMSRDIVQFVPYRRFSNSSFDLAKEVLEEVPREIVNFFKLRDIIPNPKESAPDFPINSHSNDISDEEPEIIIGDPNAVYQIIPNMGIPGDPGKTNQGINDWRSEFNKN